MRLNAFIDQCVTVVLHPQVSLPPLEYFATVASDKPQHLAVPSPMAPHPDAAIAPQANVIANCVVKAVDVPEGFDLAPEEFDLVVRPWLTGGMKGPLVVVRVRAEDVLAVYRILEPPEEQEIEELKRREERARLLAGQSARLEPTAPGGGYAFFETHGNYKRL